MKVTLHVQFIAAKIDFYGGSLATDFANNAKNLYFFVKRGLIGAFTEGQCNGV